MAKEEYFPCCSLEVHKSVENVADSPTLVFHIGRESHSEYCAVMVTGTPGMIEFYEVFMLQLHKASSCHLEVVGVSQAGKFRNIFVLVLVRGKDSRSNSAEMRRKLSLGAG